jgi:hypothetical protein
MLPTEGCEPEFIERVAAELDVETGSKAARVAALNALALASKHLGSLDRVKRVVRIGVAVVTSGDVSTAVDQIAQLARGFMKEPLTGHEFLDPHAVVDVADIDGTVFADG